MKRWGPHRKRLPAMNTLVALEATARSGSFQAAASELGLTQGAIAQQVRALEAELGAPLFERLPRGLAPTSPCLAYVQAVRLALSELSTATETLARSQGRQPDNRLVISTSPSFAARWLMPRLKSFTTAHPEIAVMIDATEEIRPLTGPGAVDLAIRWGVPPFGEARSRLLFPAAVQAVCAPELRRRYRFASPQDLRSAPLISDQHEMWPRWFEAHGLSPVQPGGARINPTTLAIDAALQGLGVVLAPRIFVADALESGSLVFAVDGLHDVEVEAGFHLLTADHRYSETVALMRNWLIAESRP